MSKRNEGKKPTQDREIELLKVQVYGDRCHNRFISLLTIPWAFFISFSAVFYTLFLQKTMSIIIFLGLQISISAFLVYETYDIRKKYKKDLKKISDIIEKVKNGKELPSLEELIKK